MGHRDPVEKSEWHKQNYKRIKSDPVLYTKRKSLNRKNAIAYQHRLHDAILGAYGRICVCCGEQQVKFLSIDHVNEDGKDHRRKKGQSAGWWRHVRDQGFPADFQILCYNCNIGKYRNGGIRPHRERPQSI